MNHVVKAKMLRESDEPIHYNCEMYPLYWTPSKEGTFCVIRLNLS